jgi:hypothetical protein
VAGAGDQPPVVDQMTINDAAGASAIAGLVVVVVVVALACVIVLLCSPNLVWLTQTEL